MSVKYTYLRQIPIWKQNVSNPADEPLRRLHAVAIFPTADANRHIAVHNERRAIFIFKMKS